jgi:hypothetical protein
VAIEWRMVSPAEMPAIAMPATKNVCAPRASAVVVLLAVLVVGAAALTGGPFTVLDSPWRIVLAGVAIAILPGMVAGQSLGFLAASPLEAIAKSFALSLVLATTLALATMVLKLPIGAWTAAMLLWTAGWAVPLGLRYRTSCRRYGLLLVTVRGLLMPRNWSDIGLYIAIAALAIAYYRWADVLTSVGGEIEIHLIHVRNYASGLPLDFAQTALRPEIGLPNLFFAWEFMLAGISSAAGIDPLIAALRSRWLFPVLGFSACFFLARQLLGGTVAARRVLWIVLPLVLTQFIALPPSPLATLVSYDRPIFSFMGSIHHADAALDILLPLSIGYLFLFLRRGSVEVLVMLAALLIVSFFFHPREYFQVMWYGAVAGLVCLLVARVRWEELKTRYVPLAIVFVAIAVILLIASHFLSPDQQTVKSELGQSLATIAKQLKESTLFRAEPLFNFAMHGIADQPPSPPLVYSWLVLLALLLPCIVLAGSRIELKLVAYFLVLWWVTLCFVPAQLLLRLVTYSEIGVSKVRFLPIIAYAVIAAGWTAALIVMRALLTTWFPAWNKWLSVRSGAPGLVIAIISAALGMIFSLVWRIEQPDFTILLHVLPWLVAFCAILTWLLLRTPWLAQRIGLVRLRAQFAMQSAPAPIYAGCCFAIFLFFATGEQVTAFGRALLTRDQDVVALINTENPAHPGRHMIEFLRHNVPPRSRILVDPLDPSKIALFAPVFAVPHSTPPPIDFDLSFYDAARQDRDPVFNSSARAGHLDADRVIDRLNQLDIDYILGVAPYGAALERLARERPAQFSVEFRDPTTGALILRYRRLA